MSGRDELDKTQAGQFAWKLIKTGEEADLSRMVTEPLSSAQTAQHERRRAAQEQTQPFLQSSLEQAALDALALARRVDHVWALRDEAMQASATDGLALHAAALGLPGMHTQHPLQSVRLARLFVRHHARLSKQGREASVSACFWLEYSHPETVTLMEELARSGLRVLAMPLLVQLEPSDDETTPARVFPDAPARLARLLDETTDSRTRIIALEFLAMVGCKGVSSSLRRALRVPQIEVRHLALETLLTHAPNALSNEDVLFLLRDLVEHPYRYEPGQNSDTMVRYAWFLHRAAARVRPPGGEEVLFDIASGILECDDEDGDGEHGEIDSHWAIRTLAAAYPDLALPLVDEQLADARVFERRNGVEAAGELPEHYAEPRLLHAAGDGCPDIAELARTLHLKTLNAPCPVDEMIGVPLQLLVAPPSERFRQRLAVLRGRLAAPREQIIGLLLDEAGDPERATEALALLVFALADDQHWGLGENTRLPETRRAWCKRLYQRFGTPSLAGLAWLALRYPVDRPGSDFARDMHGDDMGFLAAIAQLLEAGVFRKSDWNQLGILAGRRLELNAEDESALAILAKTGASSSLMERLWKLALADCDLWPEAPVVRALRHPAQLYAVDARAALEMQAAWTGGDYARFHRAALVGVRRGAKLSCALARSFLDEEAENESAFDALLSCARGLSEANRLPAHFIPSSLARPESPLFTIAVRLLPRSFEPGVRALLEAAVASTARDSRAAVDAVACLLHSDENIDFRNPRYGQFFARAAEQDRAVLLGSWLLRGGPFQLVKAHLPELLVSADPEVATNLNWVIFLDSRRQRALLRSWLPIVSDPSLRKRIERHLGMVHRDDYWQPEIPED